MTIHISREYNEEDVLARLLQIYPNLNFSPARLQHVEADPRLGNVNGRDITLTLTLNLTDAQFDQIFQAPVA